MEFPQAEACLSANRGMSTWHCNATSNGASRGFTEVLVDQQSSYMILIYCSFVYLLHQYLVHRFERGREREILREHKKQCEAEQVAIAKLKSLEHAPVSRLVQPSPSGVPRRPRTAPRLERKQSRDRRLPNENIRHFVSLSISPIGEELCSYFFKQVPKGMIGMCQNQKIICKLGEAEDHYIAQTQIELSANVLTMLNKLADNLSLRDSDESSKILQLGKFQIYVRSHDHENKVELLKLEDTESVPVVLHSTYVGGTVTVYGLGLTGANLMLATLNKCIKLETVGNKGAGGLEKHTCVVTLPSKNITEVFVYATKNIGVQDYEVCVSSLAISLQDDNWRILLRNVLPVMIILLYAAKQILSLMYFIQTVRVASIYIWLFFPLLVIFFTHSLPTSTESTVRKWCRKMYVRTYLMLYFASLSFFQECDSEIPSLFFPESNSKPNKTYMDRKRSDDSHDDNDQRKNNDSKRELRKESSIRNLDWQWPIYDYDKKEYQSKPVRRTLDERNKEDAPFKVIYYNLKDLPWASQVQVDILSPSLVKIIDDMIPDKVDWQTKTTISLKGTEFFFIHQKLNDLFGSMQNQRDLSSLSHAITREGILHLKHLLRFLDQELKNIEEIYASMESQRSLSHDMLWAFFPPGEIISYPCDITEEELCCTVEWTKYRLDPIEKIVIFYIGISGYNYNCRTWSKYIGKQKMRHFQGDLAFDNMTIYPLHFKDNIEEIKNKFLSNGKLFCELSMLERSNFKNYKGSIFKTIHVDGCWRVRKENADGRVMIDLGSFSKMNPDYNLESALPPCDVIRDNKVDHLDITSNPSRMFSPAMVYGFSFRLKEWGSFAICGFSDIVFNESAFSKLVMDETTKDLTESMVREHVKGGLCDESERLDPICAKGDGCIFLCYGPPGTGKTLTAETLAEKLHCPLWSLSVAELGTTPTSLESMLVKIMDVAVQWGALLLLDEADIYMERRSSFDLTRNAMTGVFLRQLEYFRGVIFLTTNRDISFDEALCSRISMFLCYEKHNKEQRSKIWRNLLDCVGMGDVPSDILDEFVQYEFNGREIRNVMQVAQIAARSKKENINYQHIQRSLMVLDSSIKRRASLNS